MRSLVPRTHSQTPERGKNPVSRPVFRSRRETGWETGNGFFSLENSRFPFPVLLLVLQKNPFPVPNPFSRREKNPFPVLISIIFNSISRFKNEKNSCLPFPVYLIISFYFIFNVSIIK